MEGKLTKTCEKKEDAKLSYYFAYNQNGKTGSETLSFFLLRSEMGQQEVKSFFFCLVTKYENLMQNFVILAQKRDGKKEAKIKSTKRNKAKKQALSFSLSFEAKNLK